MSADSECVFENNRIIDSAHSGAKKIALVGSAPSSVALAPFGDPSWTIWGCSSGAAQVIKRLDVWFELHPFATPEVPRAYMTPDYVAWMAGLDLPIYAHEPVRGLPRSQAFPFDELLQKYGPYFFASSISWMFAFALEQNPTEIGLWGVDMASQEEWSHQRTACHHFMQLAKDRGIKVYTPPQSDLARPPPPYGLVMTSPMYNKLKSREAELQGRIDIAASEYERHRNEWHFLRGAMDNLQYIQNTWMG